MLKHRVLPLSHEIFLADENILHHCSVSIYMPIRSVRDEDAFTNSLLLRKAQSTKIFLHKYLYLLIIIKFYWLAIKKAYNLAVGQI